MRESMPNPLVESLRRPEVLARLTPAECDLLVRQARRTGLLGRIACIADEKKLVEVVPPGPRAQLRSARNLVDAQHREVLREVGHVLEALKPLGVQVVLLKGAAYVLGDAVAAKGRLFSDIDILVPRRGLGCAGIDDAHSLRQASLFLLYLRAYWLRMPPALLSRHLLTKAMQPIRQARAPA